MQKRIFKIQRKLYDKISLINHRPLKGGIISEVIFNLVLSSKSRTKSLSLYFSTYIKEVEGQFFGLVFSGSFEDGTKFKIASKITPPLISLHFFLISHQFCILSLEASKLLALLVAAALGKGQIISE